MAIYAHAQSRLLHCIIQSILRDIIHPAAAIQGHMTLKVGVVTKDHEFLSDLKCEGLSSWRYEDIMKH